MDKISITSSGKEIFHTGNLITFGLGETKFDLHHNGEELSFIFEFIDNKAVDAKPKRTFEAISDTVGKLTFLNYKSSAGTFTIEPIYLGSIGKRELFLQYRIDDLQSNSKIFFYTFYLGEAIDNG